MDGGPCLKQDSQDWQDGIPRDRSVKNEIRPVTVARGPVPRERSGKPKTAAFPVARGPVPRDRSGKPKTIRSPEAPGGFCYVRCMARDRPSPYGKGRGLGVTQAALSP